MTDYKLTSGGVFKIDDGVSIPDDPPNRDWRKYQEWLAGGDTPQPADPVRPWRTTLAPNLIGSPRNAVCDQCAAIFGKANVRMKLASL